MYALHYMVEPTAGASGDKVGDINASLLVEFLMEFGACL
jgi:hypothetical protein